MADPDFTDYLRQAEEIQSLKMQNEQLRTHLAVALEVIECARLSEIHRDHVRRKGLTPLGSD
jgi:hypothetical protein